MPTLVIVVVVVLLVAAFLVAGGALDRPRRLIRRDRVVDRPARRVVVEPEPLAQRTVVEEPRAVVEDAPPRRVVREERRIID